MVVLVAIVAFAVGLFRGDFGQTVPVTVISDRAGLVMNPDAKVKMRGVQVGQVDLHRVPARRRRPRFIWRWTRRSMHLIPSNVAVDIASSTVFGAKFVELTPPPEPSTDTLHAGPGHPGQHVTVEINTVFQQLSSVLLGKIDPAKLNETLGAIAAAFNGRGEKFGQTMIDFNSFLAKVNPSLRQSSATTSRQRRPALNAYADAAPDLVSTSSTTPPSSATRSSTEQKNLDAFLLSAIGLADTGNDVIGGNRQALTDVLRMCWCRPPPAEQVPRQPVVRHRRTHPVRQGRTAIPGHPASRPAITLGVERYRYPQDLPKVAAKRRRSYCKELGFARRAEPSSTRRRSWSPTSGANPWKYGNQGILLNSDALKQWLFGPDRRPAAQHRADRDARMTRLAGHAHQVRRSSGS